LFGFEGCCRPDIAKDAIIAVDSAYRSLNGREELMVTLLDETLGNYLLFFFF